MKVVINGCYGGAALSSKAARLFGKRTPYKKAKARLSRLKDRYKDVSMFSLDKLIESRPELYDTYSLSSDRETRTNKELIDIVEKLGLDASGVYSNLKVVEIPDDSYFYIYEYDGLETLLYSASPVKILANGVMNGN